VNRIDRLNAILIHIQGKPRVPLEELEDRFEVSRRTIFRDIKSLIEAGVPIGGDAGEGYFVVDGYHLPPVVFDKEEAAALLLGEKFLEGNADSQTENLFKQAMYKVKAVLRYSDKEYLEALENKISIQPNRPESEFPDSYISVIQQALAVHKLLEIKYHASYSDASTTREVEPLGLVFYANRWHLIAYCRLREDLRDFRTDRIEKATVKNESYDPSKHPNYLDFLKEMITGTEAKEVIISCSSFIASVMGQQKYYWGFVDEKVEGECIQMKFLTPRYDYFARWLMSYGNEVDSISPSELQGLAATYSKELLDHHSKYFQ